MYALEGTEDMSILSAAGRAALCKPGETLVLEASGWLASEGRMGSDQPCSEPVGGREG